MEVLKLVRPSEEHKQQYESMMLYFFYVINGITHYERIWN